MLKKFVSNLVAEAMENNSDLKFTLTNEDTGTVSTSINDNTLSDISDEKTKKYKDHIWAITNLLLVIISNITRKYGYNYNELFIRTNSYGYKEYSKETCEDLHDFFKITLNNLLHDLLAFDVIIKDDNIKDLLIDRKTQFTTESGILSADFNNIEFKISETKEKKIKPISAKAKAKAEAEAREKAEARNKVEKEEKLNRKLLLIVEKFGRILNKYASNYTSGFSLYIDKTLTYYLTLTENLDSEPDGKIVDVINEPLSDEDFGLLLDVFTEKIGNKYTFEFDDFEKYIIAYKVV